jgi:hypothetical protein
MRHTTATQYKSRLSWTVAPIGCRTVTIRYSMKNWTGGASRTDRALVLAVWQDQKSDVLSVLAGLAAKARYLMQLILVMLGRF